MFPENLNGVLNSTTLAMNFSRVAVTGASTHSKLYPRVKGSFQHFRCNNVNEQDCPQHEEK